MARGVMLPIFRIYIACMEFDFTDNDVPSGE